MAGGVPSSAEMPAEAAAVVVRSWVRWFRPQQRLLRPRSGRYWALSPTGVAEAARWTLLKRQEAEARMLVEVAGAQVARTAQRKTEEAGLERPVMEVLIGGRTVCGHWEVEAVSCPLEAVWVSESWSSPGAARLSS